MARARDQVKYQGRAIPAAAYVYFMNAQREEANGDIEQAELFYLSAMKEDLRSAAIWAGLIRTGCYRSRSHVEELVHSARKHADRPALAFIAYSTCLLEPHFPDPAPSHQRWTDAEQACRYAIADEPQLAQASLCLMNVYAASAQRTRAKRVASGFQLWTRQSLEHAKVEGETSINELDARLSDVSLNDKNQLKMGMDASAGLLTSGELAVRFFAHGDSAAAHDLAHLVLTNDASDPNARLVLALADALDPSKALSPWFNSPHREAQPSLLGRVLLAIELSRIDQTVASALYSVLQTESQGSEDALLTWWLRELGDRTQTE